MAYDRKRQPFGNDEPERRGNPMLGDEGAAGLLSGRNPLAGRTPAKKTPEKNTKKKKQKPKAKPKPSGIEAVPGYKPRVPDAYERGHGARPQLAPGQSIDPNHAYGSGSGNLLPDAQLRTGAGQILAEQNPQSVFRHHLASLGLPTDPNASNFARTLQNLYESELLPNYLTAKNTQNQELTVDTFLRDWEGGGPATPMPLPPASARGGRPRGPLHNPPGPNRPRVVEDQIPARGPGQGLGQGLNNPFIRQRPGQGQDRDRGMGNPFMGNNPLLNRGRGGLGGSLPAPKPKKQPKPKVNRGPVKGLTGTAPVNPNYGATGSDALTNYRNYHLSLDPMRRGENTANIFGGGQTSWAAYR